ncbi:zinc finger CCCH domain-containing protein 14-like isoform X2 [Salvelinus namaycush]|uniref:Zinc finger CCCH domain-containing protein 14 n=1 Tax=Salvelinus namaycush TaxID=8040 RepID=A0A8U0TQQ0_SALNM|nr:zinc finger CCCH domain-containing protein 14-like isoform X2 [Salvelinus namaycush]
MVMVANKKTSQQMSDDLALFLGNNTIKFIVWLHGVLEKRRSVAVEPESMRPPLYSEAGISAAKSQRKGGGGQRGLWCPVRSLIGRRPACPAPPMSTGSPQTRPPRPAVPPRSSPRWHPPRPSSTSSPSWTMNSSTRTPWTWASCLVACVDLTLEEEECGRRLRSTSRPQGRPSSGTGRSADAYRSSEGSSGSHSRHQHGSYHMDSRSSRDWRAYRVGGSSRHSGKRGSVRPQW